MRLTGGRSPVDEMSSAAGSGGSIRLPRGLAAPSLQYPAHLRAANARATTVSKARTLTRRSAGKGTVADTTLGGVERFGRHIKRLCMR